MVLARRRAEVGWKGTLEEGRGCFTVGSWTVGEIPVTWSSRTSPQEESTSPEELMAAAGPRQLLRDGALPNLGRARHAAGEHRRLGRLRPGRGLRGFRITTMDLEVRGRVPGLDEAGFRSAAEHAHQVCPVSNALKDNVEIRVNTTLED